MKISLLFFGFIISFLLSCSSGDTKNQECRIDLVNAIENNNFQEALSLLDDKDCNFSKEEKIINKALIYNLEANIYFLQISDYISQLISKDNKFLRVSVFLSSEATAKGIKFIDDALKTYSQISLEKDVATYCYSYRKDLTPDQQDICFYSAISYLSEGIYTLFIGLSNEEKALAKQVANKLLLQKKRDTFCTEDKNKNHIIDEVDAILCAVDYSKGITCDINNVLLSSKDISINYDGTDYEFSLLKIKVKNDNDKCAGYEDTIFYKLYSKDINKIVLTKGYCDATYSTCLEPDDNACFPCPVFIDKELVPLIDTVVTTLNNSYKSMWSSFNTPEDVNLARIFRDFLKEICTPKPEYCICGRSDNCTDEDLRYDIVPLSITNDALIDYLKSHYQEEED